jgi:hypothetical protein
MHRECSAYRQPIGAEVWASAHDPRVDPDRTQAALSLYNSDSALMRQSVHSQSTGGVRAQR